MVKVIKEGNIEKKRTFCPVCGSHLEYNTYEARGKFSNPLYRYIECPVCKTEVVVEMVEDDSVKITEGLWYTCVESCMHGRFTEGKKYYCCSDNVLIDNFSEESGVGLIPQYFV